MTDRRTGEDKITTGLDECRHFPILCSLLSQLPRMWQKLPRQSRTSDSPPELKNTELTTHYLTRQMARIIYYLQVCSSSGGDMKSLYHLHALQHGESDSFGRFVLNSENYKQTRFVRLVEWTIDLYYYMTTRERVASVFRRSSGRHRPLLRLYREGGGSLTMFTTDC